MHAGMKLKLEKEGEYIHLIVDNWEEINPELETAPKLLTLKPDGTIYLQSRRRQFELLGFQVTRGGQISLSD